MIDGNNVVLHNTKHGWRVLKTLVDWFKRNGVDYFIFFDATIEYKGIDAEGMAFIESEKVSEHAKKCPSRDEADNFILNRANNTGSHVISDDGYKQWDARYPWIDTRNNTGDVRRIHKFLVEGDYLSVPDLGIWERIFGT